MASKYSLEVPSYEEACKLAVELRVRGEDGGLLIEGLGCLSDQADVLKPVNGGPTLTTVTVYPFRQMSEERYTRWVEDLLRERLAERWSARW